MFLILFSRFFFFCLPCSLRLVLFWFGRARAAVASPPRCHRRCYSRGPGRFISFKLFIRISPVSHFSRFFSFVGSSVCPSIRPSVRRSSRFRRQGPRKLSSKPLSASGNGLARCRRAELLLGEKDKQRRACKCACWRARMHASKQAS